MPEPLPQQRRIFRGDGNFLVETLEGHEGVFWDRFQQDLWEPMTFPVYDRFCRPGSVVLDIGAWIGPISLYCANRGALVHAFEPDPIACAKLERNLDLNPNLKPRVTVHPFALAASNQRRRLYGPPGFGNSCSTLLAGSYSRFLDIEARDAREVLGDFDLSTISLIKFDIEGGEYEVLDHIGEWLGRAKPALLISFHPSHQRALLSPIGRALLPFRNRKIRYHLRHYPYQYTWDNRRHHWRPLTGAFPSGPCLFSAQPR